MNNQLSPSEFYALELKVNKLRENFNDLKYRFNKFNEVSSIHETRLDSIMTWLDTLDKHLSQVSKVQEEQTKTIEEFKKTTASASAMMIPFVVLSFINIVIIVVSMIMINSVSGGLGA